MKRVYIALILSVCVLQLLAQSKFGVSLVGLVSYQFDNLAITHSQLNGGADIGGIYQLQKNNFLFQTGVNANYSTLSHRLDTMQLSKEMVDSEGIPFTYRGVVDNRVDRANEIELSVPVMVGFKVSSFYALVGAKFAYPLRATTYQTARLTSYGDYNGFFYEDFVDMPQHGFVKDQPQASRGEIEFMYDVRVCAELGANWSLSKPTKRNSKEGPQLALGLFAEYGLLNVLKPAGNEFVDVDYSQNMNVNMNHIYTTILAENAVVNNLRVGVRVALLFPIIKEERCVCINYVYRSHPSYGKRRR